MKSKKRRKSASLAGALFVVLFLFALVSPPCCAIVLDGNVENPEWWDYAKTTLMEQGEETLCEIVRAVVCHAIDAENGVVTFGFMLTAPDCKYDSPVGVAFWAGGQVFARWQQGAGGSIDLASYSISGAAYVPKAEDNYSDYYMYEVAISSKSGDHTAFFQKLRTLQLQMFDPHGTASKVVTYPIVFPPPEVTVPTTASTTTKTTKAPTTTTQKSTTTKPTTTAKQTTTKSVATTKPAAAITTKPAVTVPVTTTTAKTQAAAAKNAEQKTSVIWYTVPITAAGGALDGALGNHAPNDSPTSVQDIEDALLAEQMQAAQAAQGIAEDAPALLDSAPKEEAAPASLRAPLLFGSAGVLLTMAGVMGFRWWKTQTPAPSPAAAQNELKELEELDDLDED